MAMSMKWPEKVILCEVGPRDGLQNEKTMLSVEQKVALINGAAEVGVPVIEVGSFVSPKAVPQMADTDAVVKAIKKVPGVEYRCLVANKKGVERAVAAGIMKVKLTLSASESHAKANLNKTIEELLDGFCDCATYARENGLDVSGAISTAFGCPFEGDIPVSRLVQITERFVDLGIEELSLSDTTGMANPRQVYDTVSMMLDRFPDIRWFLHFHNTRGMALANIIAGLNAGVIRYDASLAGLGGCPFAPGASGNVSTEDVLNMLDDMGIATGIDIDKMIALGKQLQEWIGHCSDSAILRAGRKSNLVSLNAAKKQ